MNTKKHSGNMTRNEYIVKYAPYVTEVLRRTKLFPSVMMAQALIESASKAGIPGASLLASKYNNHFGIKASKCWTGPKVALNTAEFVNGAMKTVKAWFRVYKDAYQSFADRVQFLLKHPRYHMGGVFKATDAGEQARAIQRSGYATDPNYAAKLIAIITRYRLDGLDVVAGLNPLPANPAPTATGMPHTKK